MFKFCFNSSNSLKISSFFVNPSNVNASIRVIKEDVISEVIPGNSKKVSFLIENGVDIETNGNYGIKISSEKGHNYVVELLLDNGVSPNVERKRPLQLAALNGHLGVVEILVDHGAYAKLLEDGTLGKLIDKKYYEVAKYLYGKIQEEERSDYVFTPEDEKIFTNLKFNEYTIDKVKCFLELGMDINANTR